MKYLAVVLMFLLFSCVKNDTGKVIVNNSKTEGAIGSVDIKVNSFFWMLRSWKNGTLATIDRNAQFSVMSFEGENKVIIKPLVNYPRQALDRTLVVYPEHDLIISKSAKMFHIADLKSGKTKSFVPDLTWIHDELEPMLIDSNEGLLVFPYDAMDINRDGNYFIVYNYKNDQIIGEFGRTRPRENRKIRYPIDNENFISITFQSPFPPKIHFYNWRTGLLTENDLTKKLSELDIYGSILEPHVNIDMRKRFLFAKIFPSGSNTSTKLKVTWEEGYDDIKVVPLGYLIPEDKWLNDFFLSPDGQWATTFLGGYDGLYGESLVKRVFFHLDGRYPNGISMPIFAEDYYKYYWEQGAFVNHPVYGICFAEEKIRNDNGKNQRYLRLFKMDDVLADINRQLLEKANEVAENL